MINKHQATLDAAVQAFARAHVLRRLSRKSVARNLRSRTPTRKAVKIRCPARPALRRTQQGEPEGWAGQEESPYEQQRWALNTLFIRPKPWLERPGRLHRVAQAEAGLARRPCSPSAGGHESRFFEIAYATMHTTGRPI
jgi:hypothetical protein